MAAISAPSSSSLTPSLPPGGLIDPTKQAEYPVVLGDQLIANGHSTQNCLINVQYNYKTKSATSQQQSVIRRSSSRDDCYHLTIRDEAPTPEHNPLVYTYEGSLDPEQQYLVTDEAASQEGRSLVLVFDPERKVFVLEPVETQLNFNLRSAPAKNTKQVLEQYEQLRTLLDDDHGNNHYLNGSSGQRQIHGGDNASENGGTPDQNNPYDFRHFLPKPYGKPPASGASSPGPSYSMGKTATTTSAPAPTSAAAAASTKNSGSAADKDSVPSRSKSSRTKMLSTQQQQARSRTKKKSSESSAKNNTGADAPLARSDRRRSSPHARPSHPSPESNVIVDGNLIIDMGSPRPSRPAFKVNPAHFSSSNTPSNNMADDGGGGSEEEMEDLRLPPPARHLQGSTPMDEDLNQEDEGKEGEEDPLAAEMEVALEEARSHQDSDDESEVSEEE